MVDAVYGERPWLKVQRDKKYGIGFVPVRIELPYDAPRSREFLELAAASTIRKAVEQFEKLGDGQGHKYTHIERIPVRYVLSEMPSKEAFDRWETYKKVSHPYGATIPGAVSVDAAKPVIVFRAMVAFIRPLDEINLDQVMEEQKMLNESVGYVSPDNMPDEYKESLNDPSNVKPGGPGTDVRPGDDATAG